MPLVGWIILFTAFGGIASAAFASVFLLLPESFCARVLPHFVSFATGALQMRDVQDRGADQQPQPTRQTPVVAFVQAIGLVQGDVQRLTLVGPDGTALADNKAPPLDHDKAQILLFAGRGRVPPGGWPAGEYRAVYSVIRNGKTVLTHMAKIAL